MLRVDMAGLSQRELEEAVAKHCSSCGTVRKLRVYPPASGLARPFALVDMETDEQAEKLAAAFGTCAMGKAVVIILQQEQTVTQTLPPTGGNGPAPNHTLSLIMEELRRKSLMGRKQ